jgi:GAF domain-containing protein
MADLDDKARLAQFRAPLLQLDSDGVLDDCVAKAARAADAPIALVSFVMGKVQLFRAAVGLPAELELSRATSRCDSFCQFVVKYEGPFTVTDAKNDPRVPQHLVETYGIQAYLGVPIRSGGQTLGSLCVADGKERTWRPSLVGELSDIAARVSARLDELAREGATTEPPPSSPGALADNVRMLSDVIQRSLVEVGPLVRLARGAREGIDPAALARGASVLTEAIDFYDDMREAVDALCSSAKRLQRSLAPRG